MKNRRFTQPAEALLPVTAGFDARLLLAPAQALALYASRTRPALPRIEEVALAAACDRILACDVVADGDYPAVPRSSMDGFAIDSRRTPGAFRVAGEVRMGRAWGRALESGEAAAIPTGGVVPDGADAVVPVEDAQRDGVHIVVSASIPPGDCITPRASDMRAGETVLRAGRRIGSAELGLLATLGCVRVAVYARPRVAVLSSGDELIEPSAIPAPGQVRDSNRYAIAASLQRLGAIPVEHPIVGDEPGELESVLRAALADCDAAVLSGGSSVGDRDAAPQAIHAVGSPGVIVHGLRIKPGKPTVLGNADGKPIVGLPGNPVSALIVLEAVAAPILAALGGGRVPWVEVDAELGGDARGREGWTTYVPVALQDEGGRRMAHPLALRSSSVSLLARAFGYIVIDESDASAPRGRRVCVRRFLCGGSVP
jgi:molybdopterin molybdotransferase